MAGLGVCFALSEDQLSAILGRADQDDLRAQVDALEDAWDEAWTQELDEAWSASTAACRTERWSREAATHR